jgi:hypothetical protein
LYPIDFPHPILVLVAWGYLGVSTLCPRVIFAHARERDMLNRVVLALTIFFCGVCFGSDDIEFKIIDFGTYIVNKSTAVSDSALTMSQRSVGGSVELLQSSSIVRGEVGSVFGFRYQLTSPTSGQPSEITIITKYPAPGINDPTNNKIHLQDEYVVPVIFGSTQTTYYRFSNSWEIVPGKWKKEIWYRGKKVGEKEFTVIVPKS